jgi:DNA repair exonuclease SbcCD ATPase subunit
MFALKKIILNNFRSYRGIHSFELPTEVGIYFFTGQNLVEPPLGSNGSGKSTLLDAIVWALYGRTARGLRSNEVISWGLTGCTVTLELTVADQHLRIKRGQRPITLTVNDKPVDQEGMQKIIRLNFDSFMHSILSSQFGQPFLSLLPSAKLNLFSDILNLEMWLTKSDTASKLAESHSKLLDVLKENDGIYQNKIDVLKADIKRLKYDEFKFDENKQAKIETIKTQQAEIVAEQIAHSQNIADHEKQRREAKVALNELNRELNSITPKKNRLTAKIADIQRAQAKNHDATKLVEGQLEKLSELTTDCPTCLQVVRTTYLNTEKARLEVELSKLKHGLKELNDGLKPLKNNLEQEQTTLDEKTKITQQIWDEISYLDNALNRFPVMNDAIKDKANALSFRLKEIVSEKSPYQEMLREKRLELVKLVGITNANINDIEKYEAKLAEASYWIKGFKQIRLFIIEQAFLTLELEVNNSLAQLGMPNWQITFDIERENKAGGFTKGFIAFIKSPANKEPVRWENWSGGETQRLQLAADLGLSNLIMTQNGLTSSIEIYDEPSSHMGNEGILDLANMLHERALSEAKRIWIVDHTAMTSFGSFQGTISARKDNNGSHIDYKAS